MLTATESWYSQIEQEALAIVCGIEHFHFYLYGHEFTIITDHKPLELIYNNAKSRPSARIERWCLRLRDYTFQVKYRPGPTNPSDYLSRHPLKNHHNNSCTDQPNLSHEHVRYVAKSAVPVALDIENIRKAVGQDPTLQKLIEILENNTWNTLTSDNKLNTNINIAELRVVRRINNTRLNTPDDWILVNRIYCHK